MHTAAYLKVLGLISNFSHYLQRIREFLHLISLFAETLQVCDVRLCTRSHIRIGAHASSSQEHPPWLCMGASVIQLK